MRRLLIASLFMNSVLIGCLGLIILRLGGWKYAFYRLQNDEAGLYKHRKNLFQVLPEQRGSIIFLGDSQIEQCEWRELFGDSLPVLNRGIAADHVEGVEKRLGEVMRHKPAKVFLCVGVNDLLLGKALDDVEKGYRAIVQKIRQKAPSSQLVLISIMPVNNEVKRVGVANENIREMNARITQIARDYALPFVDVYAQLAGANGDLIEKYTDDGIHINGQGYLVWKKALERYMK